MSHNKKTQNPGWKSGEHWAKCQVCDLVYRHTDLHKRWDGLIVCKEDWEPRHKQDLIKAVKDDSSAKGFVRPASPLVFTEVTYDSAVTDADYDTVPSGTF